MLRPDISRLRKNRGIYLKVGFLCSLVFVTYAFSLEVSPPAPLEEYAISDEVMDVVVEIPRTKEKIKKILPPPPIEDIIEPEPTVETPEFVEKLIPEDVPVVEVDNPEPIDLENIPVVAPVLKLPEAEKEIVTDIEIDKTFDFVEEMPRFPGCEELEVDRAAKRKCAERTMMQFLDSKIVYPRMAISNNIEGPVYVSFVIGKDGKPRDFEVLRAPHSILGKEALRVLKLMPDWTPGKQRFKPVSVRYKLPIKFNLQN